MRNKLLLCLQRLLLLVIVLGSAPVLQAAIRITGTVTDESKESVIGASVTVKGSKTGVVTDIDGKYSIEVPKAGAVLVFSSVGYNTTEITVGKNRVINVVLKTSSVALDEFVAVGYGQVKKGDLAGAVSKVDMDELNKTPAASFDQVLGGRVAGVQVVTGDGQPGKSANIVIRGSNTVSDTSDGSPLWVIDGFATDDPNAAAYNPADIESMDILKDASATAIYGARGANGVIVITTKRGKESAPRVTYDGYFTWQEKPKFLKMMNGYDFVKLQTEMLTESEINSTYFSYSEALGRRRNAEDYRNVPEYNWQDMLFRGAPMTNHNITLSGGSKNTKYSAGITYFLQDGVLSHSSYESLKARLTLDQNISPTVKFGATMNFANNLSTGSAPSQSGSGTYQYYLYQVLAYRPVTYNENDDLINNMVDESGNYPYNPAKTIENTYETNRMRQLNLNSYLTWEFLKDFTFKVTFNYTWRQDLRKVFYNSDTYQGDPKYSSQGMNGLFNTRDRNSWSNEYTLNYKRRFGNHNLNALLGASLSSDESSVFAANSVLVPWEDMGFWGIDSGTPRTITTTNIESRILSFFGRVNYDWKSRYILVATMRADGSSRFPYHKWGYFPSGSFAWRLSDEPFLGLAGTAVSNLKLRVGWGVTGNNNTYSNYASSLLYATDQNYAFNNKLQAALYNSQIANRNLKWETTYQTNVGLDFGFFNNRINGEVDLYYKTTNDLLLYAEVPSSLGFASIQQNIGSISNKGLEININTVNLRGGRNRLKWTSNFNISFNKSKVTALSDGQEGRFSSVIATNNYICRVGHPLSEMYGYIYDGVYQYEDFDEVAPGKFVLKPEIPNNTEIRSNIQPGSVKLRDINGDGKVTAEDQTIIGHGLPVHTGGFTNTFEYKNFDLSVFFQWSYGNDVINYNRTRLENLASRHANQLQSAANHWTPRVVNPDGSVTEGNYTNYLWAPKRGLTNVNTDREIEDASFLRLKNIQLGYSFPAKYLKGMRIRSLRLYVSAQNVWTWTGYSGYDPEVSTRNSAMTRGFDYSSYPRSRSYTFGLKLGI